MTLVYKGNVDLSTMAINALVIGCADPGAVPGASTIKIWGRNRFDVDLKIKTLLGIVPPLSGYFYKR